MQPIQNPGPVRHTTGVIRDVDVTGRELTVFDKGTTQVFDVPTECSILLHGEPVKLRLLLPGDYAQVGYRRAGDRLVACSVRVNWWFPQTEQSRELREAKTAVLPTRTAGTLRNQGQPAAAGAAARNPGILIADGMGLILVLLKLEFEPLGFTIWLAQDGKEVVRLYRQHHEDIDLVLLDVGLPVRDGPRTLSALRRINPGVCCCLLAGSRAKYTVEDLLERGAAHVFPKPLRLEEVTHVVRQLLEDAGPARARSDLDRTRLATSCP